MNKELLDQLPADEQPIAEKLSSAAETMQARLRKENFNPTVIR